MKLEEVRESKEGLDFFLGKDVSFADFLVDDRLIKIPPIRLTKHERTDGKVRFYFDSVEEPVEFSANGKSDISLFYNALCLAYTYSRLKILAKPTLQS